MPTAIITGAGTGIGRATALLLARQGYDIALIGRRLQPLQRVADEILAQKNAQPDTKHHSQPLPISADVSDPAHVERAIAQTLQHFGRIDALVNGAGIAPVVPLADLSIDQWQEILASNLSSAFYMMRAVWPTMRQQAAIGEGSPGGVIVNISSMASRDPFPGLGAYGAAKLALNMLTLAFAREGKHVGIRVIGIAPAAVDTQMLDGVLGGKRLPADQMLTPDDLAGMIADATCGSMKYCSGETLFVHRGPA